MRRHGQTRARASPLKVWLRSAAIPREPTNDRRWLVRCNAVFGGKLSRARGAPRAHHREPAKFGDRAHRSGATLCSSSKGFVPGMRLETTIDYPTRTNRLRLIFECTHSTGLSIIYFGIRCVAGEPRLTLRIEPIGYPNVSCVRRAGLYKV